MHEAFTTTTKNYVSDLLPPFQFNRPQATGPESSLENWRSSDSPNTYTQSIRPSPYSSLPKVTTTIDTMTSRPDSNPKRWVLKTNNQVVDVEASNAGWELADEIVRLNIGEDGADDAPIRTPPKSELPSAALAQLQDSSPLETNSLPSTDSSPHVSDHHIVETHSRVSSTDTTLSSQDSHVSSNSNTLVTRAPAPLKTPNVNETKERPHSFSGGLSSADLRRLQQAGEEPDNQLQQQQQQQWPNGQYRENAGEQQLSYPSLTPNLPVNNRPQGQAYEMRSGPPQLNNPHSRDEGDYNRIFNSHIQGGLIPPLPLSPPYMTSRPNVPYRQPPRSFPQQNLHAGSFLPPHQQSLSLGNTQQLYDMMLPGAGLDNSHSAIPRGQQQHTLFRGVHHHSASDPSQIRDAGALGLLANNLQAAPYTPGMFPTNMPVSPPAHMAMYPAQFYGSAQDAYRDPAIAQAMANRLQPQYTGPYGAPLDTGLSSPSSSTNGGGGPSANNRKLGLYKTELCRSWEEKGSCRYGNKCQFAHGEQELRRVARHPKYKTEICRTFWVSGSCPYGKRCCFIHTELPNSGANAAGAVASNVGDNTQTTPAQQGHSDGRARSMSTNSDPNEAGVSILARISASGRPPTGSLRVDTSVLDGASLKQNKSAYPTFANNGVLMQGAADHITAKSPAPVTAGPDLGRHNNARLEIVGYNQARMNKSGTPPANSRHTASGSDDLTYNFAQNYSVGSDDGSTGGGSRVNGHVRAGSAGNWGNFTTRSTHLNSAYPHAPSPVGDGQINSPWTATELNMGSSRLNEKAWA
ncbi:hypothetical protein E1B28_001357 [Marasmius oreades]|uniref:C3H1-type domain-containing protein n=1 Tax=Marasmius oreades TaxID=181124 RepID=A0A9P7V3E3_9AGAR|nr:uncharacterized protein E1B28_001357 [Marasmius oreades]KAG7099512.1 hypothetical protein E1B28_001357 [Marasmius oreades]